MRVFSLLFAFIALVLLAQFLIYVTRGPVDPFVEEPTIEAERMMPGPIRRRMPSKCRGGSMTSSGRDW